MKTIRRIAIAMLIAGCGLALQAARAQQTGTKRTDLQRHDLSAPGREVVHYAGGPFNNAVENPRIGGRDPQGR